MKYAARRNTARSAIRIIPLLLITLASTALGQSAPAHASESSASEEPTMKGVDCQGWVDATYRLEATSEQLSIDLSDRLGALRTCIARDIARMPETMPVGWCDNVFKIHCSGIDLLTELGELMIEACEDELGASLGLTPGKYEAWRRCASDRIFDSYSKGGVAGGEKSCRATFLEGCAVSLDATPAADLSESQKAFVACCSADSLDGCPMIEERFTRGPCLDRPVCVNGQTSEWISCSSPRAKPSAAWLQWGGPSGDFRAPATDLAEKWPEGGPRRLWKRDLGEAYSAILYEEGRLYTMSSTAGSTAGSTVAGTPSSTAATAREQESVVCLDAATGETVWETVYSPAPYRWQRGYGIGPRSTPLLAGGRLFTVGSSGTLQALSKTDGEILWTRELLGDELGGNSLSHGYASSPVAWEDTVILPVGGENAALVAFDQATGEVRWRAHDFRKSYSSPRLVELSGETQLVIFMAEELIGLDPANGELRWRYPHANQWGHNISMPIVSGSTVFLSSPQTGAVGLKLSRDGDQIRYQEIWSTRRVQLYHGSAVRDGDWVYGSTGVTSPSFMTGVNLRTGEIAWKQRGFAKANCVAAGDKLLILDEDGVLYLATATPEELVIHAQTQLLDNLAWTVPTLVGTTLYARDRGQILAVDLG